MTALPYLWIRPRKQLRTRHICQGAEPSYIGVQAFWTFLTSVRLIEDNYVARRGHAALE